MTKDAFSYFTGLTSPNDAQTTSCYQILYFSPAGISIYQAQNKEQVDKLIEVWNRFHELTNSDNNYLIQYVEPVSTDSADRDMPPRPQDLKPLPIVMPDSPEDAQKLKAYLDGDS